MPLTLIELTNRRNICASNRCGKWVGRCAEGHVTSSDSACPLGHFSVSSVSASRPKGTQMVELGWKEVLSEFTRSLARWLASGVKVVDNNEHARRYSKCQGNSCGQLEGFICRKCKCYCYIKTKLKTEKCPLGLW